MTGYVYAIESGDAVKIGWATDPVRRVAELNVGSPSKHRLIGFARGTRNHEAQLHALCRNERIRGEWFRRGNVVSLFIEHLTEYQPTANPRKSRTRTKLNEYLRENRIKDGEFAEKIGGGITARAVAKWKYGETRPRLPELVRIETITGGVVRAIDFLNDDEHEAAE